MYGAAITIALILISILPCCASTLHGDVLLPLVKDSDVIAVIKIDDPQRVPGTLAGPCSLGFGPPISFRFVKTLRAASWCQPQLNVPQFLANPQYTQCDYYQNQEQYLVFLRKEKDNNLWWNIADDQKLLRVEGHSIRNARYYCQDLFRDQIETSSPPTHSFDASVAEFEKVLKVAAANIAETLSPKLLPPREERTFKELVDSWRKAEFSTDTNANQSLYQLSEIIDIRPAKEQLIDRAWVYLYLGQPQKAIADVNASMNNPMDAPTYRKSDSFAPGTDWKEFDQFREHSTRAFAYLRMNQTQEALADCNVASQYKPSAGCYSGFSVPAFCWLRLGQYEMAKRICDQVIETPYPGADLYVIRARAYIGLKDYEKALKDSQQAITMLQQKGDGAFWKDCGPSIFTCWTLMGEPDCSSALLARADALSGLRRYKEAKATVDQIIASAPHLKEVCGIGLQITSCKDKPATISDVMENGPARNSGLLAGDQIVEIDGKQTKAWSSEEIANHIRGPKGTPVALSITRAGKPLKFTINRTYENLGRFDSTPLLLRAYELRGKLCKELGLSSEAEQSFAEARELKPVERC